MKDDAMKDDAENPYPDDLARACVASAEALRPYIGHPQVAHLNGHIALLRGLIGAPHDATRQTWMSMVRDARKTVTCYIDQREDAPRTAVETHIRRLKVCEQLAPTVQTARPAMPRY